MALEHILGLYWDINPEEGPAFIRRFITPNNIKEIDTDDIIMLYSFCPVCGTDLRHYIPNNTFEYLINHIEDEGPKFDSAGFSAADRDG